MNILQRIPSLPLLLLLAAACGGSASGEEGGAQPAPIAVRTAPVTEELVSRPVQGTGVLAAREEVRLSFKIGGVLARLLIEEGQAVRRGQPLATLDLREIDAQVARAQSAFEKAERDLARARNLYADSVATLEQLQNATTGAEVARSDLQTAQFNRRYATIVAPAAGTILRRFAEEGELIGPGVPVLVMGTAGSGTVLRVGLADRDAVRLRTRDPAVVRFDAFPGEAFRGSVRQIAAAATAQTGTYEVEVELLEPGRPLASGLVGRVEIQPSEARPMRLVPIAALIEADGDRGTVFTLTPDGTRARRIPVVVGFILGDRVAISGGLEGVDRVVTDGVAYLSDGAAVRVAP